ncbi:MAG TPA: rhodanese-like domain-containing protein [Steroidobacteraceae bacterium]|nr:rhodanese-like domain-containing protein [Steroidobacteraceae bacterium]
MKRLATLLASALLCAAGPVAAGDTSAPLITQAELLERLEQKDPELVVLDVRTAAEFAAGHVPGALNVSHDLLASRVDELAAMRDKKIVLYCRSGRRTLLAEDVLRKAGFKNLAHLEGDYLAWEAAKRPTE